MSEIINNKRKFDDIDNTIDIDNTVDNENHDEHDDHDELNELNELNDHDDHDELNELNDLPVAPEAAHNEPIQAGLQAPVRVSFDEIKFIFLCGVFSNDLEMYFLSIVCMQYYMGYKNKQAVLSRDLAKIAAKNLTILYSGLLLEYNIILNGTPRKITDEVKTKIYELRILIDSLPKIGSPEELIKQKALLYKNSLDFVKYRLGQFDWEYEHV